MAFRLETLWYGLAMLTIVMTFGLGFYGYNLSTYDVSGDSSKFGVISETLKQSYDAQLDMKAKLQGDQISSDDAVNNMVKAGYTAARNNPFSVARIGLNVTGTIIEESNLVDQSVLPIYTIMISLLAVTIIFAIIYLIMRYRAQ